MKYNVAVKAHLNEVKRHLLDEPRFRVEGIGPSSYPYRLLWFTERGNQTTFRRLSRKYGAGNVTKG